jgi:hypothetical protein
MNDYIYISLDIQTEEAKWNPWKKENQVYPFYFMVSEEEPTF